MRGNPVALRLDQGRPLARPGTCDRGLRRRPHLEDVVSVGDDAGEAVAGRAQGDVGDPGRSRDRRRDRPLVVLADEDDRGGEDGRQIGGFVEDPLVGRAVAEEAEHHAVFAFHAQAVRGADRDCGRAGDDGIRAEHAVLHRGDVHAAALPAAVPGFPPEDLGHHQAQLEALGDAVAVAPVRARDVVAGPERGARAHGDRLHADVRVHGAADQLLLEELHRPRLERADPPHLDEELLERRNVGGDGRPGH